MPAFSSLATMFSKHASLGLCGESLKIMIHQIFIHSPFSPLPHNADL